MWIFRLFFEILVVIGIYKIVVFLLNFYFTNFRWDPEYPVLCIDFDGVLHSYTSGWQGACVIADAPVTGAIKWLTNLLGMPDGIGIQGKYKNFIVCIYSSRSKSIGGVKAMKKWLIKNGMTDFEVDLIKFPIVKPPMSIGLDDRGFLFTGTFPTEKEMLEFKPWYKRDKTPRERDVFSETENKELLDN